MKDRNQLRGFPTRSITLSKQAWDKLKTAKLKSHKTWNDFIKELLIKK